MELNLYYVTITFNYLLLEKVTISNYFRYLLISFIFAYIECLISNDKISRIGLEQINNKSKRPLPFLK